MELSSEEPGYELTTLTPMAWVDIFRQRLTLRQQQLASQPTLQHAIPAGFLASLAAERKST